MKTMCRWHAVVRPIEVGGGGRGGGVVGGFGGGGAGGGGLYRGSIGPLCYDLGPGLSRYHEMIKAFCRSYCR